MSGGARALTIAAALGAGATGGVLFAFSSFVMDGLARLPPAQGIAAMQSINVRAVRPAFMTTLFGTAAASGALAVQGLRTWGEPPAALRLAGATLYLAGTIGLTLAYHVPRNDALAILDPDSTGAAAEWHRYVTSWTRGNHVRTATALAAAGAFTLASSAP